MATAYVEYPLSGERGRGLVTLIDVDDYFALSPRRAQLSGQGYAQVRFPQRPHSTLLHREVLGLPPGDRYRVADHINRDKLDNRRANLRITSHRANNANTPPPNGPRTRGTTRKRGKWQAQAKLDGRHVTLGVFEERDMAFVAAETFRILNYPDYISEDPELQKSLTVMSDKPEIAAATPQF